MEGALSMIQKLGLVGSIDLVGATGGGAHKFEEMVKDSIGVSLLKARCLFVRECAFVVVTMDRAFWCG